MAGCGGGGNQGQSASTTITVTEPVVVINTAGIQGPLETVNAYAGDGVQVYTLDNPGSTVLWRDIDIAGVPDARRVTLVYTNPGFEPVPRPSVGTLQANTSVPASWTALQQNVQLAVQQSKSQSKIFTSAAVPYFAPKAVTLTPLPAVQVSRDWMGLTPNDIYHTVSQYACKIPASDRNLIFWVDTQRTAVLGPQSFIIQGLSRRLCGDAGLMQQVYKMLGDVAEVRTSPWFISDTPDKPLDINLILYATKITDKPSSYDELLQGYYNGADLATPAYWTQEAGRGPQGNSALTIHWNMTRVFTNTEDDLDNLSSLIIHEYAHMHQEWDSKFNESGWGNSLTEVHAHLMQRAIEPFFAADTAWLANSVIKPARLIPYYGSLLEGSSYDSIQMSSDRGLMDMFGAFVIRKYGGTAMVRHILRSCPNSNTVDGSYGKDSAACYDQAIKSRGGLSFTDEFARFGVTLYAQMPFAGTPRGYGYQAHNDGLLNYQAIDLSDAPMAARREPPVNVLGRSHYVFSEKQAAGQTRYVRKQVQIPAGMHLSVVVH